jgi:response regulator NasT
VPRFAVAEHAHMTEAITIPKLKRVLVADDEHLVSSGIAASLAALGYEVVGPVPDGQAAIDLAERDKPDLALLDIRMPVMDGLTAASRLWYDLSVPSVIVSAYSSQNYLDLAQDTGIFGYLLKPITTESLRVTLAVSWARAINHTTQRGRISQLEDSLANRRTVEMAKWKLVETQRLSEADAHSALQRAARTSRRRLVDVAQDVIDGKKLGSDAKTGA